MKNTFTCPHCAAVLNPNVKIILKMTYKGKKGMFLLSPQPGNFKFICDESLQRTIKPGATVAFACPVCDNELTVKGNKKLAELGMISPGGGERRIQFSRVYGTYATFVIDGEDVTSYGDDAEDFTPTNFFGA